MSLSGFKNPTHTSTSPPHPFWSPITPSQSHSRSLSLNLDAGLDRKKLIKRIRHAWEDLHKAAPATTLSNAVLYELFVSSNYFEALYGEFHCAITVVEEATAQSEFFNFDQHLETPAKEFPGHTTVAQVDDLDMLLDQPVRSSEIKGWEATQLASQSNIPPDTFMTFQSDDTMEDVSLDMDLEFYPQESKFIFNAQEPDFAFGSQEFPADALDDLPWEIEAPPSLQCPVPDTQPSGLVFKEAQEHPLPAWWQVFSDELQLSSLNVPSSHRVLRSFPVITVPLPRGVGEFAASQLFVEEDEAME
jgi:hypothetical protein